MKTVILEYASFVIAILGIISFLVLLKQFFFGKAGFFAAILWYVLGGL